ncbi:MAG: HNH endonuclease [Anaerolinea sp.]|nr:HNH endonuclease [Anaerolinea sp.]
MSKLVLVLNANFEPINTCTLPRAMGLLLTDKATLIANGRGEIHTAHKSFPRPSVIRLRQMIRRPRPQVKLCRREILRRDNFTCQYCGRRTGNLTIDHIIPRHLGGGHTWNNVVTACSACNHAKGGHLLSETNMHLLRPPSQPPLTALYIFERFLPQNQEWEAFLLGW